MGKLFHSNPELDDVMTGETQPAAKAPTFWFAERGFENSTTPCICMDNPQGGDPIVIAQVQPGEFWPGYVNAMCDAATRCFRMAEELSETIAANQRLAQLGRVMERERNHLGEALQDEVEARLNAEERAIKAERETHIDRECRRLGHEFSGMREDGAIICVQCGAEQ